jgi:hypothetical protein
MNRQLFRSLVPAAALLALGLGATAAKATLVAYYPLDGNFNDVVGGFNGTQVGGAPAFGGGVHAQAAVFNGSNQIVDLTTGANLQLGGNFTVSAWINSNDLSGDHAILGNNAGPFSGNNTLHLVTRGTGLHEGFFANDTGPSGTLTTGTFTHVVWQFDSGQQSLFINGVAVGSSGGHAAFGGTSKVVSLESWGGGNFFNGKIDDVAIYNTPLRGGEIAFLAAGGNPQAVPTFGPVNFAIGVVGGFTVHDAKSSGTINNLADGDALLAGSGVASQTTVSNVPVVNYFDSGGGGGVGNFGGDSEFPNNPTPGNDDDFAIKATASLFVGNAGFYTFGANTDDGSRLIIDGNTLFNDDVLSGPHNVLGGTFLSAGLHTLDYTYFERGGGAEAELFVALGSNPTFNESFALLTIFVPEPTSLGLLGVGGLALLRRRRA